MKSAFNWVLFSLFILAGAECPDGYQAHQKINGCAMRPNAVCNGADFSHDSYSHHNLSGAWLISARFSDAKLYEFSFTGAHLSMAKFNNATLTNVNFDHADLRYATFTGATLTNCSCYSAIFPDGTVNQTSSCNGLTQGSSESGASGRSGSGSGGSRSSATIVNGCKMRSFTDCQGTNFSGVEFKAHYKYNLRGGHFEDAIFNGAKLSGVSFEWAHLTGAFFNDATLTNVNFDSADLTGASFKGATLTGCNCYGATFPNGKKDYSGDCDALTRVAGGSSGSGSSGGGSSGGANPGGSSSSGAKPGEDPRYSVKGCKMETYTNCQGKDFSGVEFKAQYKYKLRSGHFEKAIFNGARLFDVDFSNGKLTGASFKKATLDNVNFYLADLSDAKFDGATLASCNCYYATMPDGQLNYTKSCDGLKARSSGSSSSKGSSSSNSGKNTGGSAGSNSSSAGSSAKPNTSSQTTNNDNCPDAKLAECEAKFSATNAKELRRLINKNKLRVKCHPDTGDDKNCPMPRTGLECKMIFLNSCVETLELKYKCDEYPNCVNYFSSCPGTTNEEKVEFKDKCEKLLFPNGRP